MVQPGFTELDTPRTNVGDATYLSRQPADFDISQEASFQSPSKDPNIFQQMRNGGGRPSLRTPRNGRAPFTDRRNLPAGIGGVEFTPLLKSATRNSTRRYGGKENGPTTPAFLDRIDEDLTPVPNVDLSSYGASRNTSSYIESTPLPQVDSSSLEPTPMVMKTRGDGKGPLQDGNQLSLREQENVIDRIEKENFGLKLKIHFLEEALRKAGPGFSEAALKENTDLKVDKVTMHRELQRYKKHLTSAEKDLESYRQQILEMQERAKRKYVDENQRAELERLQRDLEEKEQDFQELQRQLDDDQKDSDKIEKLQDEIGDLEADVREKDRIISQHEDELEDLKLKADSAEERMKDAQRRAVELEEMAESAERLEEAKDTIADLEAEVRRLEQQVEDAKDKLGEAVEEKERAEGDLEELQEEMANKSVVTKGLSRQVEEKVARLQNELDKSREECSHLEQQHDARQKEAEELRAKLKESRQARDSAERESRGLTAKLDEAQAELNSARDQKALLQTRHDALTSESASLQRDISKLQRTVTQLEESVEEERQHALEIEHDIRGQNKADLERLNDEISDLQAEIRAKENLYDNDSEKWETDRHNLESERDRAEEKAAGLQRTIDKLREAEGSLTSKETRLQEAISSETERHKSEEAVLTRQIQDLRQDLDARQSMLEDIRNELAAVRDELRQSHLDYQAQKEKAEALEDEVEVLQAALDDETDKARQDVEGTAKECEELRKQLASLRETANGARASSTASQEAARQNTELVNKLQSQLADSSMNLAKITKERQSLQDQLAKTNIDLHTLRTTLAETQAERDEIEGQLRRTKQHDDDTFRLDQERIDLRTAKMKLDSEVRRLKEENKALAEQRQAIEKSLEDEIEKAAVEEERLGHEIRQLQAKVRQSAESQDLSAARRTIRELERRIEDYQDQLAATAALAPNAGEGSSEMSLVRRDLSDARAKERDYLQREATHKEAVKSLKRQIAELERAAHQAEMHRLAASPSSSETNSSRKAEISELRHQLSSAHQSMHDLKKSLRDAERQSSSTVRDLQERIDEMEEEKAVLEQAVEDAQAAAHEAREAHESAAKKYKAKLDRCRRERDDFANALADAQNRTGDSDMSREARKDLHAMLRRTQVEAEARDRELREQKDAYDELVKAEEALRKKLDRARSERASYRADSERLQREVKSLRASRSGGVSSALDHGALVPVVAHDSAVHIMSGANGTGPDTGALIRASEDQRIRHQKELRAAAMQIEWMQARWERETQLRDNAASAKRLLQLELDMRVACNKADLQVLQGILRQLGVKESPTLKSPALTAPPPPPFTLKRFATVVRFVVRLQLAARRWAQHEEKRAALTSAAEGVRKAERMRRMRDEWRAQMAERRVSSSSLSSSSSPRLRHA